MLPILVLVALMAPSFASACCRDTVFTADVTHNGVTRRLSADYNKQKLHEKNRLYDVIYDFARKKKYVISNGLCTKKDDTHKKLAHCLSKASKIISNPPEYAGNTKYVTYNLLGSDLLTPNSKWTTTFETINGKCYPVKMTEMKNGKVTRLISYKWKILSTTVDASKLVIPNNC